jgi:hypothetical protein
MKLRRKLALLEKNTNSGNRGNKTGNLFHYLVLLKGIVGVVITAFDQAAMKVIVKK